jgi:secreted PhoX family phosphatase
MQGKTFKTARRDFLKRSASGIVSATTLSLLTSHMALGHADDDRERGYGPLARTPDQNGQEILALPQGFSYVTFSKNGSPMLDGTGMVPNTHDGMASFRFYGRKGPRLLLRPHIRSCNVHHRPVGPGARLCL